MHILVFLLAATHLFVHQTAIAAEIDSITPRSLELDNSISVINDIFNQRISEGVRNANQHMEYIDDYDEFKDIDEDEYCDEEALYTELRRAMFQSLTASWGLKGYDLDRQLRVLLEKQSYSLSLNDSVYRDIDYLEGFSLNLKELSDVVNVNGHLVGLDKIGHFFAEGWDYFEITHIDGQEVERALEWGRLQESGKFGYSTTGIYSFADLAANFNGWRFWNRVLLKQDDPLKSVVANYFLRPYVSCKIQIIASIKNRKIVRAWEANARFDFSDYIDGAWDEGNNCNSYADPFIEQKVTARIKNIDPQFKCPYDEGHCVRARKKYSDYAKYVLHPYCLTAAAR